MANEKSHQHDILSELKWRGLIFQQTHEEELAQVLEKPTVLYCGFDPSASSLQVGNLLLIITLARFRLAGHKPIALAGGATGLIGDPSGKSAERTLLTREEIASNAEKIGAQLRTILDRAMEFYNNQEDEGGSLTEIPLVNNADWTGKFSFLDFLRDVGKHFSVNIMMSRESVRARLEERDQGISYTEFSYQLIQSYDFYHLFREFGCRLQVGGSDQWGNIISGTDFIRRSTGETAFGLTLPLVTDSSGRKLGKSEGNAIYLAAESTSPYHFYQFWVNQEDAIVIDLLKKYTFLTEEEIGSLAELLASGNNKGEIQQRLAYEVTRLVHGEAEVESVVKASKMLFGEKIEGVTEAQLVDIFADVPTHTISKSLLESGINAVDLFSDAFKDSKSSMRRLLQQGGGYINNERLEEACDATITLEHRATPTKLVLRAGRKRYCVIDIKED